jgi:adenylosuccinate synthase
MARAFIVAGLAYGDEGKGSWVDHLVRRHGVKRVVRFNGGAQAGHQVTTPDGREHIFAQFGSGMFVPETETLLSRYMLVEPEALLTEACVLEAKQVQSPLDRLTISENAPVITPMNRVLNRILECMRGNERHGSCGFGIGLTQADVETLGDDALYVRDLRHDGGHEKLRHLYTVKREFLSTLNIESCQELVAQFNAIDLDSFAETFLRFYHRVRVIDESEFLTEVNEFDTVFEGAQGVLLDQWYGYFPHCTRSNSTFENALSLLAEANFSGETTRIGLLRGYSTRHGAGPFVTEDSELLLPHCHNHTNDWQGNFRLGWFDAVSARYAIEAAGGVDTLAITNLDRMKGLKQVKIASSYVAPTPSDFIRNGRLTITQKDLGLLTERTRFLNTVEPHYREISGWCAGEGEFIERYLKELETLLDCPIGAYSANPHHQKVYR